MIIIKANLSRVEKVVLSGLSPVEDALEAALWTATARGGPKDQMLVPLFRTDSAFICLRDGFAIVIKADPDSTAHLIR